MSAAEQILYAVSILAGLTIAGWLVYRYVHDTGQRARRGGGDSGERVSMERLRGRAATRRDDVPRYPPQDRFSPGVRLPRTPQPDAYDITEEEHQAAKRDLVARHGAVPPSLQRVEDLGGRYGRVVPEPDLPALPPRPAWDGRLIAYLPASVDVERDDVGEWRRINHSPHGFSVRAVLAADDDPQAVPVPYVPCEPSGAQIVPLFRGTTPAEFGEILHKYGLDQPWPLLAAAEYGQILNWHDDNADVVESITFSVLSPELLAFLDAHPEAVRDG